MNKKKKQFYILSGYSGAGKTIALRSIEELGFYCVDNLPADLLDDFSELLSVNKNIDKIAVVIDARGKDFMRSFKSTIVKLKTRFNIQVLFFDTSLEEITRRFKESRLKHPLSLHGSIKDGYEAERTILEELRQNANLIINTTLLNVHAQKSVVQKYVQRSEKQIFEIHLMSFGFKYGIPAEADVVIDVRFLDNPFFVKELKNKTGLDRVVQKYIFNNRRAHVFMNKTKAYLDYLLREYRDSGKNYANVSFGCTGGRHRSVAVVQELNSNFMKKKRVVTSINHRDINES
ncbi:MAG: RNase adapter RapZ [Deltaproteobacteria bacterium]|nr:RNase adapter RapZ [Deltaproteobacteria bacterium]